LHLAKNRVEQSRTEYSTSSQLITPTHYYVGVRSRSRSLVRLLLPIISSGPLFPVCVLSPSALVGARCVPGPLHPLHNVAPRLLVSSPGVPHCNMTNLPPPELQSSVVDRATKPRSYGVSGSSSGPMIRPASASGWGLDPPHGAFGVSARPNHIQPHTTISLRMVKVTPFTSPQKTSGYACSASGEDPMGFLLLNWLQAMPPSPSPSPFHPSSPRPRPHNGSTSRNDSMPFQTLGPWGTMDSFGPDKMHEKLNLRRLWFLR
jgi:hypothetical protein